MTPNWGVTETLILVFDLWFSGWGFGFTLYVREDIYGERLTGFDWQVKLFGKTWGTGAD